MVKMENYERWALLSCFSKSLEQELENQKMAAIVSWPERSTGLKVMVGGEEVGNVRMDSRTSGYWQVVDPQQFEPFARETLDRTVTEIDASMIPDEVVTKLATDYPGSVRVHEVRDEWKDRVRDTPAGPVLDTGEPVPGVAWTETATRYLVFKPGKGLNRNDVLDRALASGAMMDALALPEGGSDGE